MEKLDTPKKCANGGGSIGGGGGGSSNSRAVAPPIDKMCAQLNHMINLLTLNATMHMCAASFCFRRYACLAIPSLALSGFVRYALAFRNAAVVLVQRWRSCGGARC